MLFIIPARSMLLRTVYQLCICKNKISLSLTYSELSSTDYTAKLEENTSISIVLFSFMRLVIVESYVLFVTL